MTVSDLWQLIQQNALYLQAVSELPDQVVEVDEMFQNAGKTGLEHFDPHDPPRRRARKQCGRGTEAHDCPPICRAVGCERGQVRLRVLADTQAAT